MVRRAVILGLLAVLLTGLASGAVPPGCVPRCEVPSHELAYAPPVTYVSSGATVTWTALDKAHTASAVPDLCFHAGYSPGKPAGARFAVVDGELHAGPPGGPLETCAGARPLVDGGFALQYYCVAHPNTMKGILVVK